MRIPEGVTWELLVVNNNSTDDTESVITSYENRLPLRRLFEPSPGLSNARNHAIREAKGGLIIWTDDDVLVDSDWLAAYAAAADRWPDAAFFGGPIEAMVRGRAACMASACIPSFVSRDFGKEPCVLTGEIPSPLVLTWLCARLSSGTICLTRTGVQGPVASCAERKPAVLRK